MLLAAEFREGTLGEVRLEGPADLFGFTSVDLVDEPDHHLVDGVAVFGLSRSDHHF